MIDISEKDLLNYLEKYANKEISMNKLVKELQSDYRKINNKIIEMSINYPNLYYKIITNNPYKQKLRADIDFEALMIYILKEGITIEEATKTFNVSRRTIQRRVKEIEVTNPDLYSLFKDTVGRDAKKVISPELQEKIQKLEYKTVVVGEINDERENFLVDIEKRYNDLVMSGMTHEQAAREIGYSYQYVRNVLNELYRIRIERNVKQQAKSSNEFRGGLSNMSNYSETPSTETSVSSENINDKKEEGR